MDAVGWPLRFVYPLFGGHGGDVSMGAGLRLAHPEHVFVIKPHGLLVAQRERSCAVA